MKTNDRAFRARLHHVLLLAVLTPTAGCGGATASLDSADSGGSDGASSDGASSDAGKDSSPGNDAGGKDAVVDVVPDVTEDVRGDVNPPYDGGCGAGDPVGDAAVCLYYVTPPCGYDGGALSTAECLAICNQTSYAFCSGTMQNGAEVIQCSTCVTGRRPTGVLGRLARDGSAGDFFARCAWLEAASVHAFRRLARELTAHGAPRRLASRALVAARDEVRHARTTASIARRFGAAARKPPQPRLRIRRLEAIARENAVEGCVRETYGAIVASWQARNASDPQVARALAVIARDEARHAAIAWEVAAWIEPRLRPSERARIERARQQALVELRAEIAAEPPRDVADKAGVPGADQAACLLDAMVSTVMAA